MSQPIRPPTTTPNVAQTTRSPIWSSVAGGLPLKGGFVHSDFWRIMRTTSHQPRSMPAI